MVQIPSPIDMLHVAGMSKQSNNTVASGRGAGLSDMEIDERDSS